MDSTIQNHALRVAAHNFREALRERLAFSDDEDVKAAIRSVFEGDDDYAIDLRDTAIQEIQNLD